MRNHSNKLILWKSPTGDIICIQNNMIFTKKSYHAGPHVSLLSVINEQKREKMREMGKAASMPEGRGPGATAAVIFCYIWLHKGFDYPPAP